jgi:glycosyltransferase involved in cell wall biosynthesis
MFFIKNKTKIFLETSFLDYPHSGIGNFLSTYIEGSKDFESIEYLNKSKIYRYFRLSIATALARKFKIFRRFEDYFYRFILLQLYLLFQPEDYLIISPYHNLYLPYSKKKYVTTVHDLVFIEKPELFFGFSFILNKFLLNWSLNNSKVIITVSEDTKKRIENKISSKTIIHIVYNSYPSLFHDYQIPDLGKVNNPYILYFGGADPRKDLSLMFKIYETYKIVGKGNLKLFCTKFREDYEIFLDKRQHLDENIEFLGEISTENLVNNIINCEAIFYLSDYEGFGRPVMEAAAFNKSIIVKNLDVFKEITKVNTLIVDDLDSGVKVLLQLEKKSVLESKVKLSLDQKFLLSSNISRFQNIIKQYIEINYEI